jgi:hypothetical protein
MPGESLSCLGEAQSWVETPSSVLSHFLPDVFWWEATGGPRISATRKAALTRTPPDSDEGAYDERLQGGGPEQRQMGGKRREEEEEEEQHRSERHREGAWRAVDTLGCGYYSVCGTTEVWYPASDGPRTTVGRGMCETVRQGGS